MEHTFQQTAENAVKDQNIRLLLDSIIARNFVLRLLLIRKYNWVILSFFLCAIYYLAGFVFAVTQQSATLFISSRQIYVCLAAIVACVTSACWYAQIMRDVFQSFPKAFNVNKKQIMEVVHEWLHITPIWMPVIMGIAGVPIAFISFDILFGIDQPLDSWLTWYVFVLLGVCGFMLCGGIYMFIATILIIIKIFQFEVKLFYYRELSYISNLSAGLTIFAFIAVFLNTLINLDRINNPFIIATLIFGALGATFMFLLPQLFYQSAITREKKRKILILASLHDEQYIKLNSPENVNLTETKDRIEALKVMEENISRIPNWLVETSDLARIVVSAIAPVGLLVVNELISRIL